MGSPHLSSHDAGDFGLATNFTTRVIELVRPHLQQPECTIITGYQDFFSSLSILLTEVPALSYDDNVKIQIAFGTNTENAVTFTGQARPIAEETRLHFLGQHGLSVVDSADLKAILAIDAIKSGRLDLRIYDPATSSRKLGIKDNSILHAKIVSSPIGAVNGSANFSRAGLYRNIECSDDQRHPSIADEATSLAKERKKIADAIWEVSVDWNAEAIKILESLLRPVTTQDAVARLIHEQKSFAPWCVANRTDAIKREPLVHQADIVYEASSVTYEHGFSFVSSPAGSGKTDIGKLLGYTLGASFEHIFGKDHTGRIPRGGALAIVPPKVLASWSSRKPRILDVQKDTLIAQRKDIHSTSYQQSEAHSDRAIPLSPLDDGKTATDLEQYGVIIIDESHGASSSINSVKPSNKGLSIEFAPPSWNVCLSATLLGNQDLDWLAHLHEKRASIFMSNEYLQAMDGLFRQEGDLAGIMLGSYSPAALSDVARESLAEMLSPFLIARHRTDIGESSDRRIIDGHISYPPFKIHPRPAKLSLSNRQKTVVAEISALARQLAPGRKFASKQVSRFGTKTSTPHKEKSLHARNIISFLRCNSEFALWELEHGVTGRALRRIELEANRKRLTKARKDEAQLSLFGEELPSIAPKNTTPITDKLTQLVARPDIQRLDKWRYEEAVAIQKRHHRVVFLAERLDTLRLFASHVAALSDAHTLYVVADENTDQSEGVSKRNGMPARMFSGFTSIKDGERIESFFRPGGVNNNNEPASIFLSYTMAEGINLQSADGLVMLGITSSFQAMVQGMGRIDRIDSPHEQSHYYLLDTPVTSIASDQKISQRLNNYRVISGDVTQRDETLGEGYDVGTDTNEILQEVANHLQAPRTLRMSNYHDILTATRNAIDPDRYDEIVRSKPHGLWGAEIGIIEGSQKFTILHLRGEHSLYGQFSPPRLLIIEDGKPLLRNQVKCAQRLKAAYEESCAMNLETRIPERARLHQALEDLGRRVEGIKEWQLAPERTDSLLHFLCVFLSRYDGCAAGEEYSAESLYGDLTLRGVEYITETWSRLLDPYWIRAKENVYETLPKGGTQSYVSMTNLVEDVLADEVNRGGIVDIMRSAINLAERVTTDRPDATASRISVALMSLGSRLH